MVDNLQAGGIGFGNGTGHAGYWRGTPESFTDLHPIGAYSSGCAATDGTKVGGRVQWASIEGYHAAVWHGTRESLVDLHPAGATVSTVSGMAPGVQVGLAFFPGSGHAAMWRGTAASYADLNPPGVTVAELFATTGRVHAGVLAQSSPLARAALNFGSPDAWLDLHQFLAPEYDGFSSAKAVYQDGPTLYVGGHAESGLTGYNHAILWIGPDPCYVNCDRSTAAPTLNVNDFVCFLDRYAAADPYANCDGSSAPPTLNVNDFICFLNRFVAGCP